MKRLPAVEAAELRAGVRLVGPALLILAAILWALSRTHPDAAKIAAGTSNVSFLLDRMFPPDLSSLGEIREALLETLRIVLLGTAGCIALSLLAGPLASATLSPAFVRYPMLALLAVIRSVPMLVVAVLLVVAFQQGPMSGILAMAFHATGVLSLQYATALDAVDRAPLEALRRAGAGRLARLRFAVWPQVAPEMLRDTLLRFESNLRDSLTLGLVGAGGIGVLFGAYVHRQEFARIPTLTLVVIAVVAAIELANFWFRRAVRLGDK